LFVSDIVLARSQGLVAVAIGVGLWGLHMGLTQGLLATMVAAAAPEQLRGTGFGFFNLASGIAMLAASALAGFLWDKVGASATFYVGSGFTIVALILLFYQQLIKAKLF
jgi:predicted MFS family arabinose efflux permease